MGFEQVENMCNFLLKLGTWTKNIVICNMRFIYVYNFVIYFNFRFQISVAYSRRRRFRCKFRNIINKNNFNLQITGACHIRAQLHQNTLGHSNRCLFNFQKWSLSIENSLKCRLLQIICPEFITHT